MIVQYVVLVLGVFFASTAVIMIKASNEHPVLLAAYRQIFAALMMAPIFIREWRRHRDVFGWREFRASILPGIVLGVHFISWIVGARLTTAVNGSLIVNLSPIAMPFLLFFMTRERINRPEIAGTILALAGLMLLTGSDLTTSTSGFLGDVICFASMILFTLYLAMARRNRNLPSVALYVVPLYMVGGIFCLLIGVSMTNPIKPYTLNEVLLILGLAALPTVLGHSAYNYAMKHVRGQIVSIFVTGQFVPAGILAYFLINETPSWQFYLAAGLVAVGAWLSLKGANAG